MRGELDRTGRDEAWDGEKMRPQVGDFRARSGKRDRFRSEHVHPDFVKIFVDGSAGARKAAYLEPYLPDEIHGDDYYGEFTTPPERLKNHVILLDRQGLTVKMHCGGDAAVRAALDAIQAAREVNGDSGLRHEVAHANLVGSGRHTPVQGAERRRRAVADVLLPRSNRRTPHRYVGQGAGRADLADQVICRRRCSHDLRLGLASPLYRTPTRGVGWRR